MGYNLNIYHKTVREKLFSQLGFYFLSYIP